jgi:hypothetical protein
VTWPNDVVTRVVTGAYLSGLGTPAKGRVTFTPTTSVHDTNDALVVEDTITVVLNANGEFSLALPTTDNPLLSPSGWAYEVNVRLYGVKPKKFNITLPVGDGTPVSIINNLSATQTTPVINEVTPTPLRDHTGAPGGTFNDVVTRTVIGTYLSALGNPAKGRVTFTPTTRVVDANDAVIVEDTLTATLDAQGSFEIDLPTTDNQLLAPEGWAYEVNVRIYGVKPQKFYATLPYGDGTPVDIDGEISLNNSSLVSDGTIGGQPVQGPIGPKGDTGPTGPSGPTGPQGATGPGTLVGAGAPASITGVNGDIYIDSLTGSYYGPKASGAWPASPFYVFVNNRYIHTQASPSSVWNITHSLGGRPSVMVVDSAGTVVIGEISYNSNTSITISFTAPFSGYAYLT